MNKVKFSIYFILIMFVSCFLTSITTLYAVNIDDISKVNLEEKAEEILVADNGNIDITKVITEYEKLTQEYTNDEIADMIEKNKDKLEEKGISSDVVSAGTQVLRTMDEESVTKILKEDIKIDEVKEKLEDGYTPNEVINYVTKNLTTKEKVNIALKLLFANKHFKIAVIIISVIMIYSIILRWIIFSKAGKHGFAAIIPIYRDVVYFKICSISPWVILFILLPIIGWLILAVLKILSKFELSYNFGRKTGFGFGLWLLPIIFESIIAFSREIRYVEE